MQVSEKSRKPSYQNQNQNAENGKEDVAYVAVSGRSEEVYSSARANVFDNVSKGILVLLSNYTITRAGFTGVFRFHHIM